MPLGSFMVKSQVLFVVPSYQRRGLPGARQDVTDFFKIFSNRFSEDSKLTLIVDEADKLLTPEELKRCQIISPVTEEAVFHAFEAHMQYENAVIILAGHGKSVVVDGYTDQAFVVPAQVPIPRYSLNGLEIAKQILRKKEKTKCLLIIDSCLSSGIPDKGDFERAKKLIDAENAALEDGLVDRCLVTDVISGIQSAIGWFQMSLNGTETIGHTMLGSGLTTLVGIGAVLLVTFMMACTAFVYWRQAMANQKGTLFSMLVVGALSAVLPYMCDARMLQTFVSVENSMYLGTVGALLALLVIVLHNAADWTKITKVGQKLTMFSHVAAKSTLLTSIAIQIHFMGLGDTLPQTMRIQIDGVSKYVMYRPPQYSPKKEDTVCLFSFNQTGVVRLLNESGQTAVGTTLSDGSPADLTCQYPVFQKMVAQAARNNMSRLMEWSFNDGEFFINVSEIGAEVNHLKRLINNVNDSTWPKHPLLSQFQNFWELENHLQRCNVNSTGRISPPTLKSQPELPWVYMFAAPLIKLIEHLAGISLWPLWLLKQ